MWAVVVVLTEASVDGDIKDSWCQQIPMDYCNFIRTKTSFSW